MAALDVAEQARQHQVKRLVFAHIGRPSLRAIDVGYRLPFGEWGELSRTYRIPGPGASAGAPASHATDTIEVTGRAGEQARSNG